MRAECEFLAYLSAEFARISRIRQEKSAQRQVNQHEEPPERAALRAGSRTFARKAGGKTAKRALRYDKNSHPARICRPGNPVRQGSTQASEAGLHNVNRHRARGLKNIGVTELPP